MAGKLLEKAATYKRLSVLLSYPTARSVAVMRQHLGEVPSVEDLQQEYQGIFGGPLPGRLPPMETEYDQAHVFSKTQTLADVAGFYRAFGLESADGLHRLDHIAVQLEFGHVLALKEGRALSRRERRQAAICRKARREWLRTHLAAWGVPYLQLVSKEEPAGTYGRVAETAREFLVAECRELAIELPDRSLTQNEPKKPTGEESCPTASSVTT